MNWHQPYRIALAKAWGVLTLEDLDVHSRRCVELLTEAQEQVPGKLIYLIFDGLEIEHMPPLYTMISRALPTLRFNNRGTMFFVTPNKPFRSVMELTAHVMNFRLRVVTTVDEALAGAEATMLKDDLRRGV